MAAIKRSQANQRRHPDSLITVKNHHNQQLGHCQEQLGSTSSGVKVELQYLIVSILDDPIVSRVFNDAGFSSFDVKLALLRPFQGFFRYPPRFFDGYSNPGYRRFEFPFLGYWDGDGDGDYRRIVEVLMRKKGRNPLLVGGGANDVLRSFVEVLERRKEGLLPLEIRGINVVSIEKDVLRFQNEKWSDEAMNLRLREVDLMIENCFGPGLMINFGNLTCFLNGENGIVMDVVNCVVGKLTKLLEIHGDRIWLIGSAINDQMYMEFVSRFPAIDRDWDLQPLPITSIRPSMEQPCFNKSSLMGSFVPFGGFFSSPSDLKGPFSSSYQYVTSHNMRDEKFEQEKIGFSKRGSMASVVHQNHSALSTWLQADELGENNTWDNLKAKGGTLSLSSSMVRKWDPISECQSHTRPPAKPDVCCKSFQLSTNVGFHCLEEKVKYVNNESCITTNSSCKECNYGKIDSCMSADLQKHPTLKNGSDAQTSPSGNSVATDLGLDLFSKACKQRENSNNCFDHAANDSKALFQALFGKVGRQCEALRMISQIVAHSWASNGRDQKSGVRGDIWLNFIGPDVFGKQKTALALADLYGGKKNFIRVDLCSKDVGFHEKKAFGCQIISGSETRFRGMTVVDHIAEELRKMPSCVVLLENVHSADPVAQHCLLQAIRNGKFSDSYGREVTNNNRIFVLTSRLEENNSGFSSMEKTSNFPEERIARAKGWPIQLVVKGVGDYTSNKTGKNSPSQIFWNKRKLDGTDEKIEQSISMDHIKRAHRGSNMSLDLNLPAEDNEADANYGAVDGKYKCERSESWLQGLSSNEVYKTLVKVVFDPFDYDALAAKLLKLVHECFYRVVGSKCSLEIEPRVVDQMIAATCLSEGDKEVEDWVDRVLSQGFAEAQKRYKLNNGHSILMIATCEALCTEEHVPEVCLPSKFFFELIDI